MLASMPTWNNQQHVHYIDSGGHAHELWYSDGGGWFHNDITHLAGADGFPAAQNSHIVGYASPWNREQHVIYLDSTQGHVHELWYSDGGGWKHNDLSQLAGATNNFTGQGTGLNGYVTSWNKEQHVDYVGDDGWIYELWYSDNDGWKVNNLGRLAAGTTNDAILTIDGYATEWNNQQHVNYHETRNTDGSGPANELWYSDGGGWQLNNLTHLAGADNFPVAKSSPIDGYTTPWNKQQHLNYIDVNGYAHELWYSDGGGWKHNDLTNLAGAQAFPAAPGSPLDGYATPWNNEQHVNYVDGNGHVHELWYSDGGGWNHNDLTQLAGAQNSPAVPGSPLDSYVSPWNNQQHVNYIDGQGHIHELMYSDGGGWKHNDLTQAAGAQSYPAASGSPLDGYVT